MTGILLLALALLLHLLGRWGRHNATSLVPTGLSPRERARTEQSLRRGAWACHGAAGILLAAAGFSLM